MGRYICYVYVSNPFLMNCRVYANYMQVNYTCVPSEYGLLKYLSCQLCGATLICVIDKKFPSDDMR